MSRKWMAMERDRDRDAAELQKRKCQEREKKREYMSARAQRGERLVWPIQNLQFALTFDQSYEQMKGL